MYNVSIFMITILFRKNRDEQLRHTYTKRKCIIPLNMEQRICIILSVIKRTIV